MRLWPAVFLAFVVVTPACGQDRALRLPQFDDYPVSGSFSGNPAAPKLATSLENSYAVQIRNGIEKGYGVYRDRKEQKGPNFAGSLIVIQWGCGSPCMRMAVVEARTGVVHYPPISFDGIDKQNFDLPLLAFGQSVPENPEIEFRLNSNLMVIRATPKSGQQGNHHSYGFYFLWGKSGWTLLRKVPLAQP